MAYGLPSSTPCHYSTWTLEMPPMSSSPPLSPDSYSPPSPSFPHPLPVFNKNLYSQKKNIPAHTPTCILARHPHTRLSMGLSLRPKFFVNSSSAARRGETWDLDPDNFFLRDFFLDFFFGDWSLRTGPPPFSRVELHSASSYCCVNYT